MKLGFFFDFRNPPGWRRDWQQHTQDIIELAVEIEERGADSVWFSEHHLFDDGYLTQPFVLAAAVAARTSRVRIGTAIVLAALRHPRHIAEESALVDLISGGRFELGLGAGYVQWEFDAFDVDLSKRFVLTDRAAREVSKILADPAVLPPPVQQPLPVWLGYQTPKGARRAGRIGVGLLSLDRAAFAAYVEGLEEGGHDPKSARNGGVLNIVVARDPDKTRHELAPFYAHQINTYAEARGAAPVYDPAKGTDKLPGMYVLTPDDAVAMIRARTEGMPVEHVYLWASVGAMPDAMAAEHIDLVCSHVRPALVG